MEYREEDYLALSGIQHFAYCRRQWALIHIEQQWNDNFFTASGNAVHENAHNGMEIEKRKGTIILRGLPVASHTLGISGICDVVELQEDEEGMFIKKHGGKYLVIPVEYKRGKPKMHDADILQVVAQAICLEEMLCIAIEKVAVYYGQTRHREYFTISKDMRKKVISACEEMHDYYKRSHTPRCRQSLKCQACSLKELCIPELSQMQNVSDYINNAIGREDVQ